TYSLPSSRNGLPNLPRALISETGFMARHAQACVGRKGSYLLSCVAIMAVALPAHSQVAKAPAQVTLTGVVGVVKPARALLEVEEGPGLPIKKISLREGEREGSIELVAIDVARNRVRIRDGGVERELGFGGLRPVAPPPIAAVPLPPAQSAPVIVTSSRDGNVSQGSDVVLIGTRERPARHETLGL